MCDPTKRVYSVCVGACVCCVCVCVLVCVCACVVCVLACRGMSVRAFCVCVSACVCVVCVCAVCVFAMYLVLFLLISFYMCNTFPFPLRSHGREVYFVSEPPDLPCLIPSLPFDWLQEFFPEAKAAGA